MKTSAATYRFGKFTLNAGDHRLCSNGQEIYLRPKTYDTLLYLLVHQGRLVTKNELLDAVWADVEVTENVLSQCIKEARVALGDDVQNPQFLKTLPRLGYEFIAQVQSFGERETGEIIEAGSREVRAVTNDQDVTASLPELAAPLKRTSPPTSAELPVPRTGSSARRAVVWFAALALVGIAVALTINYRGLRGRLAGRASSPRITSLAVLPLENLTGDPQQEYFADGMTEELITNLGKLKSIRVISRTSVMRYKKTDKPLPQIANELNVDAVIEGAVLRAGNSVRITAQLIYGPSDKHLWAESYGGDLQDILALQSEVAGAITREIKAEIAPLEQARQPKPRAVNPEAYALYLEGKVHLGRDTDADNRAAIDTLKRAVAIDPNFAPAYAALGRAYVDRLFGWEPKDQWNDEAVAAIDKALLLDPNLAEAHASRAALLFTPVHNWQYERAIQESQEALALDPNLAEGHLTLGHLYFHVGLLEEARGEFQTAAAINPTFAETPLFLGFTLMYGGKFHEALPFLRIYYPEGAFSKMLQAACLWEMGRKEEAWAMLREMRKADPQEKFVWLAGLHAVFLAESGADREAEKKIENMLAVEWATKRYGHFHHTANFVAQTYAQLNKPEQAVRWLEETAATGFPCYPWFEHDRALDPIRQDPRFVSFMQKQKSQWESLKSKYGANPN